MNAPSTTHFSLTRDVAVVVAITMGTAVLAAHFELNEAVFAMTRRWESLQLDEWPIALLVLALCLMWLSWRRYLHARLELEARQVAEAGLATALAENRALGHQHLRALEAERKHLARELHDELGQYLNAMKLDAVAIQETGDQQGDAPTLAAARILKAIDHVHGVVSDMIRRLRPVGLDDLGLVAAIESCVDQWRQRAPATRFALSATTNLEGLNELTNLTIYRVVQECLTNSQKHARAKRVELRLQRMARGKEMGDDVVMTVRDDGCGTDLSLRKPGFGLGGMRERVEMLGGRMEVRSAPGEGFELEARIPCAGAE